MKKVLMFTSPTCGPCKQMKPIICDISKTRNFTLEIIEASTDNMDAFKDNNIRVVPTVMCLEDDKEIGRFAGATSPMAMNTFFKAWEL